MLQDFKKFALRGNVVDLAIGVIIGAAFGAIVQSLVSDVLMPVFGAATGGLDFSNHFVPLSAKVTADSLDEARRQGAVLAWGRFCDPGDQLCDYRGSAVLCGQADEPHAARRS
jgi:large conductance mechanosensitive channel